MKRLLVPALAALVIGAAVPSIGALLEVADSCDGARKQLEEIVKHPDTKEVEKVMELLGVDILASCDVPKGKVVCFQCLDDKQKLRSIQLFQDGETLRFSIQGYGCRCTD